MSIDNLGALNKSSAERFARVVSGNEEFPKELDEYITSYKGWDLKQMVGRMNFLNREIKDIDHIIQQINRNNELVGIAEEIVQENPQAIEKLSDEEKGRLREALEDMARQASSITDKNGLRLWLGDSITLFKTALQIQLGRKGPDGRSFKEKYPRLDNEIFTESIRFHGGYVPSKMGNARLEAYTDTLFMEEVPQFQKIEQDLYKRGFLKTVRQYEPGRGLPISRLENYVVPSEYESTKEKRKDFENYFNALEPEKKKLLVDFLIANYDTSVVAEDAMTLLKEGVRSEKDVAMKLLAAILSPRSEDVVYHLGLNSFKKSPFKGLDMDVASAALEKGLRLWQLIGALDTVFSGVDRIELANYILKFGRVDSSEIMSYEEGDKIDLFLKSLPSELEHELRTRLAKEKEEATEAYYKTLANLVMEINDTK